MGKIISAINMTLDGFCDHTAVDPDAEIHQHYTDLLSSAEALLYGRVTYELMQFWQTLLVNPSGVKSMDEFALAINKVPKVVFSKTLTDTGWDSAKLTDRSLEETVRELKLQPGGEILIGSRSLMVQLLDLQLIDELQICVHPVIAGGGLPLFDNLTNRNLLKLTKTKTFRGGAVILYYEPKNERPV